MYKNLVTARYDYLSSNLELLQNNLPEHRVLGGRKIPEEPSDEVKARILA